MLTSTLRTVGGSVMMTIPKPVLDMLGLSASDKVVLHVEAGRLMVEARKRPKYSLSDLLAEGDAAIEPTEENRAWDEAPPVGREII